MIKIVMLVLLSSTAAMAEEKVRCIEIESVAGQPFFECVQPTDRPAPGMWKPVERIQVLPPPFETPKWVPNEETKQRALRRAYELNGNKMCCGSIDVSDDPVVTGRTVITPETEFNVLDAKPVVPEKKKKN